MYPATSSYAYVANSPINYIDPDGMFEQSGNCCIPKDVMEFGQYLVNQLSGLFKPKPKKTETSFEKFSKWFNNLFSGLGGGRGYGGGTENYARKEGVENMDPIDYSELPGAFRGGPFKLGKTKMGPFVNSTSYLWSGFSVGYEAAESIQEKIDVQEKITIEHRRVIGYEINPNPDRYQSGVAIPITIKQMFYINPSSVDSLENVLKNEAQIELKKVQKKLNDIINEKKSLGQ